MVNSQILKSESDLQGLEDEEVESNSGLKQAMEPWHRRPPANKQTVGVHVFPPTRLLITDLNYQSTVPSSTAIHPLKEQRERERTI